MYVMFDTVSVFSSPNWYYVAYTKQVWCSMYRHIVCFGKVHSVMTWRVTELLGMNSSWQSLSFRSQWVFVALTYRYAVTVQYKKPLYC